jgi:hypothetical protein
MANSKKKGLSGKDMEHIGELTEETMDRLERECVLVDKIGGDLRVAIAGVLKKYEIEGPFCYAVLRDVEGHDSFSYVKGKMLFVPRNVLSAGETTVEQPEHYQQLDLFDERRLP